MKTLVIPDIHNRINWVEQFLAEYQEKYGYDEVVFLGDYFDSFGDNAMENMRTAYWLRDSLAKPDRKHILGNHDMPYMCPKNPSLYCPGFTNEKSKAINDIMTRELWMKLVAAYETQGWLLSHAGAAEWLFSHPINGMTAKSVVDQCEQALKEIRACNDIRRYEFMPGSRMSNIMQLTGGITWAHWDDPVEGINQIVGHTQFREPLYMNTPTSKNCCLDTCSQHHLQWYVCHCEGARTDCTKT